MDERPVITDGVGVLDAVTTTAISSVPCSNGEASKERGWTSRSAGNPTKDQRIRYEEASKQMHPREKLPGFQQHQVSTPRSHAQSGDTS